MYMIKEKVSEGLSRLFNDSPNSAASSTSSFGGKSKAWPYSPEGRSLSSYFSYIGFGHKEEPGAKPYKSLLVASSNDPSEKNKTPDCCGSESPPYESYVTPKCDQHTALEISKAMGDKEEGDDPGSGKSSSSTDVFKEASESHCPEKPLQNLMDQDSAFISPELYEFLSSCLPNIVKGCQWVLLYSTAKHGISLRTLIRKSSESSGPCLVIAGDMQGAVFGGLLDCPLKPTPKRKYQGSHQTFVFTTVYGQPRLFRATGSNRYYYICMNDMLALGGGGNFALRLDSDLLNATSGPCETFGSLCLAHKPDFELKNVEVWGFAHMSDYVK